MSEHTPTPWTVYDATDPLHIKIKGICPDIGGAHVADILSPENADFLLKAVNNHDTLVTALKEIVRLHAHGKNTDILCRTAEGALAVVGGSKE